MDFGSLFSKAGAVLRGGGGREPKLQSICELLRGSIPHYAWAGFYVADEGERVLRLGPFAGAATEHVVIPYGRGICGQVAVAPRTFVVPDVALEDNYLSCSLEVRSEIVVPVMVGGRFVAQLDIDSHQVDPFTGEDRRFLEALCAEVAACWESCDGK